MLVAAAEVLEQVVDAAAFGHKVGLAQQRAPVKVVAAVADVGEQVARVEDAHDGVLGVLVHRYAGVAAVVDYRHHLVEGEGVGDVGHVDARRHNLRCRRVAELEDALQYLLVVALGDVGNLEGRGQVVGGDGARLLGDDALDDGGRADKQTRQRRQHRADKDDAGCGEAHPLFGIVAGVELGQNFAEKQNEEGEDNRLQDKAQYRRHAVEDGPEGKVGEHDDGHVYQVVGDEYCRQQPLGFLHQSEGLFASGSVLDVV